MSGPGRVFTLLISTWKPQDDAANARASLLLDEFLGTRKPQWAEAVELDGRGALLLMLDGRPHLLRLADEPDGQVSLEVRHLGPLVQEKLSSDGKMRLSFGNPAPGGDLLELEGETDRLRETRELLTPRPETPLGT